MNKKVPLLDGNDIPLIGLSSFCCNSVKETSNVIKTALELGIRSFEISELFGNGHTIIESIINSGIKREEVYITYKIWPKERGPKDIVLACLDCLSSAGLTSVDMLILHGPLDIINGFDQWRAFEYLQTEGMTKSIGLADYSEKQLTEVLKNSTGGGPCVCMMESTPFRAETELTGFCNDGGIVVLNNNPLGKNYKINDPLLVEISNTCGVSPNQLLLKWAITNGHSILLSPQTIMDNDIINFDDISSKLPDNVVSQLEGLDLALKTSYVTREIAQDD